MNTNTLIKIVLVVLGLAGVWYAMKRERFAPVEETVVTPQLIATKGPEVAAINARNAKDSLSAEELLPKDENSSWDQVNPKNGDGSVAFKNFLEAGNMFGIDTQGASLRNANQSLRSEPLIKQMEVSPWSQSTIDPDIYRKPLESSCRQ